MQSSIYSISHCNLGPKNNENQNQPRKDSAIGLYGGLRVNTQLTNLNGEVDTHTHVREVDEQMQIKNIKYIINYVFSS